MPEASRFTFRPSERHALVEVPISTLQLFNRNLPSGGGGYFRLLPYGVSRWALRRIAEQDRRPAIFYFHPWEVAPDQPRFDGDRTSDELGKSVAVLLDPGCRRINKKKTKTKQK